MARATPAPVRRILSLSPQKTRWGVSGRQHTHRTRSTRGILGESGPIRSDSEPTARRCSRPCAGRWDGARCVRCVERERTRSVTTGDCGPVAQCRGRRGAGDGDEDLHPRGHGGDDATCLSTRPSYHRDRPRPSRAAPARRSVRSVVLLTQTRVGAWARGDARSLSPSPSPGCSSRKAVAAMAMPPPSGRSRSPPRMRTAGQRTTDFMCVKVHAPAARFLCVAALGRRQAAARQLASCSTRAPRSVPVPRSAGRPS